jgi:hypothetical protein
VCWFYRFQSDPTDVLLKECTDTTVSVVVVDVPSWRLDAARSPSGEIYHSVPSRPLDNRQMFVSIFFFFIFFILVIILVFFVVIFPVPGQGVSVLIIGLCDEKCYYLTSVPTRSPWKYLTTNRRGKWDRWSG